MVNIVRRLKAEMVRGRMSSAEAGAAGGAPPGAWRSTSPCCGRRPGGGADWTSWAPADRGPEWLVRVPLEHVCRQLHGADVERAIALVYSLLHRDLVASTLALLVKPEKRYETLRRPRSTRPTVFDWIREDQSGGKFVKSGNCPYWWSTLFGECRVFSFYQS